MKKWTVLIALLMVFVVCGSPDPYDKIQATEAKWQQLFPQRINYDFQTREDLIRLYQLSPNKYLWFPDSFPAVYKQKNLYHHKYNQIKK